MSDLPPPRHGAFVDQSYRRLLNVLTLFQESYVHLGSPERLFEVHWFRCLTSQALGILGRPIEIHFIPTKPFMIFFW